MGSSELVHPCFLYEFVWCIIGFFVLNYILRNRKFKGQVVLSYCVWYGFMRGFVELLRTDSLMLGNIRVSSLLSFLICIFGLVLIIYQLRKQKTTVLNSEYHSLFESEDESLEIEEDKNDEIN